jgi:hypothetical protein
MRFKKYIKEYIRPYDGSHVPHTSSLEKIKQAYGNTYKVDQVGDTWVVFAEKNGQWIPVTTPFADKVKANEIMAWLKSAEKGQKAKLDTIGKDDSGKGPERYPMHEAKKPSKGTLYIKWSTIFDSPANKYDTKLFMKTLKDAGAKKVWTDNAYGWDNQPEVVLFTGLNIRDAESALSNIPVFKKWGAIILDASEDWE